MIKKRSVAQVYTMPYEMELMHLDNLMLCLHLTTQLYLLWLISGLAFMFSSNKISVHKKATIHLVTTMLATSKNVLFPGHNHLLTTGYQVDNVFFVPSLF